MRIALTCALTMATSLLITSCASVGTKAEPESRPSAAPYEDLDGDGLPNGMDRCPADPEDIDLFEDEDGCPDDDNDRDGVPDVKDKCRNEPMVRQPGVDPRRGEGCPDDLRPPAATGGQ